MIYRGVSDGLAPPGIEFYLPLFFDSTDTLLDYLPAETVVCAELALDHSVAWVPLGGVGVPVAVRMLPFTTVNGDDAGPAASATVGTATASAAVATATQTAALPKGWRRG